MKNLFCVFSFLLCFLLIGCQDPTSSDETGSVHGAGTVDAAGSVSGDNFNCYTFAGKDAFSFGFKNGDYVSFEAEYQSYNKHKNQRGGYTYSSCRLISMTRR